MANGSLTWLGHAAFRLDTPGGKRVYIDPFLENPKCPPAEKEPEPGFARTFMPSIDCSLALMRLSQDFHRDLGILSARQNAAGLEPTTPEVASRFYKALSP